MDDFSGSCGQGRYPLLSTIVQTLRQRTRSAPRAPRNRAISRHIVGNIDRRNPSNDVTAVSRDRVKSSRDYLPIRMENMNGPSLTAVNHRYREQDAGVLSRNRAQFEAVTSSPDV